MCFICGRSNCSPSFHSTEEQRFFERAEEAFERYLKIRKECAEQYIEYLNEKDKN